MPNIFKSIWNNPKVKRVQKKRHELEKKLEQAGRELERAKHAAARDHKKKHSIVHHAKRRRY